MESEKLTVAGARELVKDLKYFRTNLFIATNRKDPKVIQCI